MERTELTRIKQLFGDNLIGPEELSRGLSTCVCRGLSPCVSSHGEAENDTLGTVPPVTYSWETLESHAKDYLLVLGMPTINGVDITLRHLRDIFGIDPEQQEPCFYNQDWYLNETFLDRQLESRWYLLKKEVFEASRAVMPQELLEKEITFPSAILCAYTFFAYYLHYRKPLWVHDFIWCCDLDHNGDRIYVGKYHDIDGVNKNGFSIHRHLALRPCYAAVDAL